MYCNRSLNTKINQLQGRCDRKVYNDKNSTFDKLLGKDDSAPIPYQNLQKLAFEKFKVSRDLNLKLSMKYFRLVRK